MKPFPRSYWVIPGVLLAGEFPAAKTQEEAKNKIDALINCGIRQIINLMEPHETDHSGALFNNYELIVSQLEKERSVSVRCLRLPIADLSTPTAGTMRKIIDTIMSGIEDHRPVYVHCWGGIGRTGTVVGCFLLENGLATPGNVLNVIAELRSNDPKRHRVSPETDAQRKFVITWREKNDGPPTLLSRSIGCLMGGAVGDALGASVEFMSREEILQRFGPDGITEYAPAYGGVGKITDDTQMSLFTAEGLLRAWVRGCHEGITTYTGLTAKAYLRWLRTQGEKSEHGMDFDITGEGAGWLYRHKALHNRRAPGGTCITALRTMSETDKPARNNSKGCGGVMRVAPVGLFFHRQKNNYTLQEIFRFGMGLAALTHGHPTGALPAGVLSVLIFVIAEGEKLPEALSIAKSLLKMEPRHEETLQAIELAEKLSTANLSHSDAIARIGQGWVAEEALAISIYCALVAPNFREGVIMAVNHDGDSDSTGAITGNLLGATYGVESIPDQWLEPLELREVITEVALDLNVYPYWDIGEHSRNEKLNRFIWNKYPGY